MRQDKADALLALLLEHGVNHIDTAAMYGDSELRVGAWMPRHRDAFFLATKTHERTAEGARGSLERSRQRLRSDVIDLIQLHNLVDEGDWPRGARAGRGARGADRGARARPRALHRRHRPRHARRGDAPRQPRALPLRLGAAARTTSRCWRSPTTRPTSKRLLALCAERGVAVQTIKSIARRRWPESGGERRYSWYEPIREEAALRRAARFVLSKPGLFLNSSSDATLLPALLAAAAEPAAPPSARELEADAARLEIAPLFVRGVSDAI